MKFYGCPVTGRKNRSAIFKVLFFQLCSILAFSGVILEAGSNRKTVTDVIPTAMKEELARSMKVLGVKEDVPPYYIAYRIIDTRNVRIGSSYGALQSSSENHSRYLDVDLRVGSHKLDNTRQIRGLRRGYRSYVPNRVKITTENDADAIKYEIWRITDREYKKAMETFIRVKANRRVTVSEEDKANDFSNEKSVVYKGEFKKISPDIPEWEAKLKACSALFKKYPDIRRSYVVLNVHATNRFIVTSEKTDVREGNTLWRLAITASVKADDGMVINRTRYFNAFSGDKMPGMETLENEVKKLAEEVLALRSAPLMEPYSGPAILSGNAAGVFFHEIFGHRIEGNNLKDDNDSKTFAKKLGTAVLPEFISVYDDPNIEHDEGRDLMGHYLYDDEGMKAQRVNIVENGVLKKFLMSRSPVKGFSHTNGHGRSEMGKRPVSRQGNLVVESSKTFSMEQLREMLIAECKKQGKQYGLFFENVTGGFTNTRRFNPQVFNVTPVTVYRVYVDGRPDELVRGINLVGTPLTAFSKIVACSRKRGIFNGICGAESGYVPVSSITPALLTSQIEVEKKGKSTNMAPVLSAPALSDRGSVPAGEDDAILRAMKDELSRSMKSLKIKGMENPYFMEYTIHDTDVVTVDGSFGAITQSKNRKVRNLKVDVRVGDYNLDNTGLLSRRNSFRRQPIPLVRENDYDALRRALWLRTDDAFKSALEHLASKKSILSNQAQEEWVPDFSKEKKVEKILPRVSFSTDKTKWEPVVKRLSAVFKMYPKIGYSYVNCVIKLVHKYYVNSEGTVYRIPEPIAALTVYAGGQAVDGMRFQRSVPFSAAEPGGLPSEKVMTAAVHRMAMELTKLVEAPVLGSYRGPVLFEGQPSAELFSRLLVPHLSGERPPVTDMGRRRLPQMEFSKLADKIGTQILPEFLTVVDDPMVSEFDKQPLMGGYVIDDQGVVPKRLKLVENGVFKSFLMNRRPRKDFSHSNGHGRAGIGTDNGVQIGNLFITGDNPNRHEELKKRLIAMCKKQGLKFGLTVKSLKMIPRAGYSLDTGPDAVYKVYVKDGREELVRGLTLEELSHTDLKKIIMVGDDPVVFSKIAGSSGFYRGRNSSITADYLLSFGVPVSIVCPSMLLEDMEFEARTDTKKRGPVLTHPYFAKK